MAGCLESGSLRRLLPQSKKPLKNRRMLHSAFWNHGASELDLSTIWNELILEQGSGATHDERIVRLENGGSATTPLLDFLYPAGTFAFTKQCMRVWAGDRQDIRRRGSPLSGLGRRLYSSLALGSHPELDNKPLENIPTDGSEFDQQSPELSQASQSDGQDVIVLENLIDTGGEKDYGEVWRLFDLQNAQTQKALAARLIKFFSNSQRRVDAERTIKLFSSLPSHERDRDAYSATIRAHTILKDIQAAVNLHRNALSPDAGLNEPAGSDVLIAYFLDASSWTPALEVWQRATRFHEAQKLLHKKPIYKNRIWQVVDTMPIFPERALALASYTDEYLERTFSRSAGGYKDLQTFAADVVGRVLIAQNGSIEASMFAALLRYLKKWDADSLNFYESIIDKLLIRGQSKLAVKCYRDYRQRRSEKLSRHILHGILKVFCKQYSVLGMQQVLEDFFKFYDGPTSLCYRMCMNEFAAQGNADIVKTLFEQYRNRFSINNGPQRRADDIAPLLHVHAKRGEIEEVLEIFHSMEERYHVTPSLKCWNILLNAFGTVQDMDAAASYFDKLLRETPFAPDAYTFGTMMGIAVNRGDLDYAKELYQLAKDMQIPPSTAMVDCLVLGYIQEDDIQQAEKLCEDALEMDLEKPPIRMWNYLLTSFAMRADLGNTNRVLSRMQKADLRFNALTYAALMQGLAITHQPSRAYTILKTVMPAAGARVRSFHYAVVMGGFIATNEPDKVFQVHNRMIRRGLSPTMSTQSTVIKASALKDQRYSSPQGRLERAERYFQEAIETLDPQEIVDPAQKGLGREGVDVDLPTAYFEFLVFVYGQRGQDNRVQDLFDRYLRALPKRRRAQPSTRILSALMISKLRTNEFSVVEECWALIFEQVKTSSRSSSDSVQVKIPPARAYSLAVPLSTYMQALVQQDKIVELQRTVNGVLAAGFKLDNKNWNLYIQILVRHARYKQAFELCETVLMDGWMGWARVRWQMPGRNRLPYEQRTLKKTRTYLRPIYHTMLFLARGLLDLQGSSAETKTARAILEELEETSPRTLLAIRTMQRVDDDLERLILRGD
jgi:pentatricopeptide repeat-containing protein PET309